MGVVVNNLQEYTDNIDQVIKSAEEAVQAVLKSEGRPEGVEVSVALVDDVQIRDLNREYRGKDCPTDVLSFPMDEEIEAEDGESLLLLGDVVISLPTAIRQSGEYGWTLGEELTRLTVHGTLHLFGYDHEADEAEGERMRRREEEILRGLGMDVVGG